MNTIAMFLFTLGAPEIIIGVLVIVLLFGGKKIPELMKGLGKGMSEFKKAKKDAENEDDQDTLKDIDNKK